MMFDEDNSDSEQTNSPLQPSKLRTRIMASGYKYKLLAKGSRFDLDDNNGERPSVSGGTAVLWRIIAVMALICVALLVSVIVVAVHRSKVSAGLDKFCTSPSCIMTSASLLEKMNLSADPCEDMYEYACGEWLRTQRLPSDEAVGSVFSAVEKSTSEVVRQLIESEGVTLRGVNSSAIVKMKTLYKTCMDETTLEEVGITPLLQLISSLGSWTVTEQGIVPWDRHNWTIQQSVMDMHPMWSDGLFVRSVDRDAKNASLKLIYFSQSGLTLSRLEEYTSDSKFKNAYLATALKIGLLLGGDNDTVMDKMTQVFEFEKKLSGIRVPAEKMTDPLSLYNKMKLSKFQTLIGSWIDIIAYLRHSFSGKSFSEDFEVVVKQPEYFGQLGSLIQNTSNEVLANYMMWRRVVTAAWYLPQDFMKTLLEISRVEAGTTSLPARWKQCLEMTNHMLGFVSSALFIEEKFSSQSKVKVRTMLEEIRGQFVKNLDGLTWLDKVTKDNLREKAMFMKLKVGYPDWILDVVKLDKKYEKLEIKPGDMFGNLLGRIEFENNKELEEFDKKTDPDEWAQIPSLVNAWYSSTYNDITIPAGILQPPIFSPEYPDALNYGSLGMIIGHELTHGFDMGGRRHDKYGNLREIWTESAAKDFVDNAQCIADQYSSYKVQGNLHVNGKLTLSENIADNGGVKFAFNAMRESGQTSSSYLPGLQLSDDQLFFLGFSQVWCDVYKLEYLRAGLSSAKHSPGKYRVIGTLSNNKNFAKAYQCGFNSTLNPENKCYVW